MQFHRKIWLFFVLMITVISCSNDMDVINKIIDPEEEPDVLATDVETWYTDSARLQMKMIAPILKQYVNVQNPRDEFPEGLHAWMYEKDGTLKAEVSANWAKNDHTTKIWEAQGNVVLIDASGARIESEQMFWDQEQQIVYSNKFTKYTTKTGNVATGRNGMHAKQDFSEWKLLSGNATLIVEDEDQ